MNYLCTSISFQLANTVSILVYFKVCCPSVSIDTPFVCQEGEEGEDDYEDYGCEYEELDSSYCHNQQHRIDPGTNLNEAHICAEGSTCTLGRECGVEGNSHKSTVFAWKEKNFLTNCLGLLVL